jgi:cholesterol oxidase
MNNRPTPAYRRLSTQQLGDGTGEAFFECVIVGSGFGGAVMAARLSPYFAPGQLVVLERGKEYQPGDFPTTLAEAAAELRTPVQPLGLFDVSLMPDMDSLVGNALGGTSNIYANVMLEPRPEVFDTYMNRANPRLSRCWPASISYKSLKPYFTRVRQMLAVEKYIDRQDLAQGVTADDPGVEGSSFYGAERGVDPRSGEALRDYQGRTFAEREPLAKTVYLHDAMEHIQSIGDDAPARRNGGQPAAEEWAELANGYFQRGQTRRGDFSKAPIAVNLTQVGDGQPNAFGVPQRKCTLCGDCVMGCNVGAKNTLTMNYLPLARQRGASLITQVEVHAFRLSDRPEYRYRLHATQREYAGSRLQQHNVVIYTNMLVLSAGVFGTNKLMFEAQRHSGIAFSEQLGQRFSGNADAIAVSYNSDRQLDSVGYGAHAAPPWEVGPTITALGDFRRVPGRQHLIEDGAFPSALVHALGLFLATRHAWRGGRRVWHDLLKRDLLSNRATALNHSQVWLSMGHDYADGKLWPDARGRLRVRWKDSGAQPVHEVTRKTFKKLAEIAGARHVANPRDGLSRHRKRGGTPITVHPLGGCCMAEDSAHGVVDDTGRVFDPRGDVYPGLYISDASICDASLGANPSLTIAALAERAADQIIENDLAWLFGRPEIALANEVTR